MTRAEETEDTGPLSLLSLRTEIVGQQLKNGLLFSAAELRVCTGLAEHQVNRALTQLRGKELVDSVYIGRQLPRVGRHWLLEAAHDVFGLSEEERSWHSQDAVANLLRFNFNKVECIHEIARLHSTNSWRLSGVPLHEREPMMAVAEYRHANHELPAVQVFCAPSLIDNQRELSNRIEQLRARMFAQALDQEDDFYPAGLCIVAADEWAAAQSLSMACVRLAGWVHPANITAWYRRGNSWYFSNGVSLMSGTAPTQLPQFVRPSDPLRPSLSVRKLGPESFDRIRNDASWGGRATQRLFGVVTLLGQYPVIAAAHLQALAEEGRKGKEMDRSLADLIELGLAEIVQRNARVARPARWPRGVPLTISRRGQGGARYALTHRGLYVFWCAHGGNPAGLYTRSGLSSFHEGEWSLHHQDGIYEFLAQCREAGCAVAPGWRATAALAKSSKSISPDGVVLFDTYWGTLWCYVEYELSDRSVSAFRARCETYGSKSRMDAQPLLLICVNERAEQNFWVAVEKYGHGFRAMSTTLHRLQKGGVCGAEVWKR